MWKWHGLARRWAILTLSQAPPFLIHSLLTYETGWSKQAPPRVHGRTRVCVTGSQVVPGPVAGSVLEMQTLGLIPDLLHQKLWG